MTFIPARGMALPILCIWIAACGTPNAKPAGARSDPNTPAVVSLPRPVLPSDTAKPDTASQMAARREEAKRTLLNNYAVLGAAVVFGDGRMIASQFDPTATLATADSTYKGVQIITTLAQMGEAKSLRDFSRRSKALRIVDSTVIDSGSYLILSKRAGADSIAERGAYATTWRIHPSPLNWLILADHLYPAGSSKKRRS